MTEFLGCIGTQNETCGLLINESANITLYDNVIQDASPVITFVDKVQYGFSISAPAVVLQTKGRMGNQLFQYAAAYALAKETSSDLYLFADKHACSYLKDNDPTADITYYLTQFNLSKDTTIIPLNDNTADLITAFYPSDKNFEGQTPLSAQEMNAEYISTMQQFNEAMKHKNDKILVMASYFESQAFSDAFNQELISQYTIPDFDTTNIKDILDKVSAKNSVCMNVRRKEYVLTQGHVPIDYQEQAMKFIATEKLLDNPKYFVISDDIELVKQELKSYDNIDYLDGINSLEALYILSHCANNIMTFSSFSWWGSYLNNNMVFSIIPCSYYDLFKTNSLTFKLQFTIEGKNKCNNILGIDTDYVVQYKDNNHKNMIKYKDRNQIEIVREHVWNLL